MLRSMCKSFHILAITEPSLCVSSKIEYENLYNKLLGSTMQGNTVITQAGGIDPLHVFCEVLTTVVKDWKPANPLQLQVKTTNQL